MSSQTTADYPQLVSQANTIFQQSYPGAFTYTAIATPNSGQATTAADLVNWVFRAKTNDGGAELTYSNGSFGKPVPIPLPPGLEFVPLPQGTVTLDGAIQVLNDHGYTSFGSVSMGTPVYLDPQPMFWFCADGQTQGVSARTKEFYPNLFPCAPGELNLPQK